MIIYEDMKRHLQSYIIMSWTPFSLLCFIGIEPCCESYGCCVPLLYDYNEPDSPTTPETPDCRAEG